jgi:two-component system response regulator AgrA
MEYPFYDTLDQLEERLADRFLRCHRSYLVNKSKVNKVYLSQNLLLLNSGEEIPLSRSYKPVVKQFMMEQKR